MSVQLWPMTVELMLPVLTTLVVTRVLVTIPDTKVMVWSQAQAAQVKLIFLIVTIFCHCVTCAYFLFYVRKYVFLFQTSMNVQLWHMIVILMLPVQTTSVVTRVLVYLVTKVMVWTRRQAAQVTFYVVYHYVRLNIMYQCHSSLYTFCFCILYVFQTLTSVQILRMVVEMMLPVITASVVILVPVIILDTRVMV